MRLPYRLLIVLVLGGLGAFAGTASAQHLVYAEYFIDNDPGQGFAVSIQPCDGVFDEAEEEFCVDNIAVPALDDGRHVFVLRMKDSQNRWGMRRMEFYSATSSPYAEKTITDAEYYIDSDPGIGNGADLPAADGVLDAALEFLIADSIESAALSLGQHTLYARIEDSYGVWSVPRAFPFRLAESNTSKVVVAAEYFIDTDPGVGKGIPLNADDGQFDGSVEAVSLDSIATLSLCPGEHTVFVRFRDNWSHWPRFNGWGPTEGGTLTTGGVAPGLNLPPAFAVDVSNTLEICWENVVDAVRYHLQVNTGSGFGSPPVVDDSTVTSNCRVVSLGEGGDFFWRVRTRSDCGWSPWSEPWQFTAVHCCSGNRGNANNDPNDKGNLSDVTYLINWLFGTPSGPPPVCREEANVNDDHYANGREKVIVTDVTYMLKYLFDNPTGPAPKPCPQRL